MPGNLFPKFGARIFLSAIDQLNPRQDQPEVLHKASVDKKDLDVEGQQIAKDLKLIQYDMVAGKGYLSKNFFKVHSE